MERLCGSNCLDCTIKNCKECCIGQQLDAEKEFGRLMSSTKKRKRTVYTVNQKPTEQHRVISKA